MFHDVVGSRRIHHTEHVKKQRTNAGSTATLSNAKQPQVDGPPFSRACKHTAHFWDGSTAGRTHRTHFGDFCSRMCLAGSRETLTVKPENASDTGIRLPAPTTACLAVKRCWSVLVAGRPLRGSLPLYPTTHSVPAILNQRLGPVDVPTSEPGVLETMGRTNPRAGASSARQEATTPAETISRQKTSAAAG